MEFFLTVNSKKEKMKGVNNIKDYNYLAGYTVNTYAMYPNLSKVNK